MRHGSLSRALARERFAITYRPEIAKLLGDPLSAIIFQSILSHANESGGKPFAKFYAPCPHPDYQDGSSWLEELQMTRDCFSTALKRISTRVAFGEHKDNARSLVFDTNGVLVNGYDLTTISTDPTRKSWFDIDAALAEELLCVAYMDADEQAAYIAARQEGMTPPLADLLPEAPVEPKEDSPVKKKRAKAGEGKAKKDTPPVVPGWTEIVGWWCGRGEGSMGRPFLGQDGQHLKAILKLGDYYKWTTPELIANLGKMVVWMREDRFMATQISTAFIAKKLPNWVDTINVRVPAFKQETGEDLPVYNPVLPK